MKRATIIKSAAASLAFVPMVILFLGMLLGRRDSVLFKAVSFFYFPVGSLFRLVETFHLSHGLNALILFLLVMLWSSLIAGVFWKIAGTTLGEDEPEGKLFDWVGFQTRFFCGAIVGIFFGWRGWIGLFSRNSTVTGYWGSMLLCTAVGAVIGGLAVGFGWREDVWGRRY